MALGRNLARAARLAIVATGVAAALAATTQSSDAQSTASQSTASQSTAAQSTPGQGAGAQSAGAQAGGASAPAAAPDDATLKKGRELFDNYGCGSCHTLKDDGAMGDVGPSLDGDANLTQALVVDRVTNGGGPMPSFNGQMSPAEMNALAAYVVHAAAK